MSLSEEYKKSLLESIPVVSGMDVEIQEIEARKIILSAPLNTNINYEGTAFGGSINTLAILSCYLLTHHILKTHDVEFDSLVIQNSEIDYLEPVDSDFQAIAQIDEQSVTNFLRSLQRRNIGRLVVESKVVVAKNTKCLFKGRFVAGHFNGVNNG